MVKVSRILALIGLLYIASADRAANALPNLQQLIDHAADNETIVPPPGVYHGSVVIRHPVVLDGAGKVTIDADGKGSVIYLKTNGAVIKRLHLTNSGSYYDKLDAGIQVRGDFNVIKDNVIDNCLFGIDLEKAEYDVVRRNRISSKPLSLGLRGDAIRLWYSFNNKVTDNKIRHVRDTVVWYSKDNVIARNDTRDARYALHFMYSHHNIVEGNHYQDMSVGIFLMYSDNVEIRDNYIARAYGPTGMGIGFKESSGVQVTNNRVQDNAVGIYIDVSPYDPDAKDVFKNNVISFNGIGVHWLNSWHGNIFSGNAFLGNLIQVAVDGGGTASGNTWDGNYWDDYEFFDRNHDGIGDRPYHIYSYADSIWEDVRDAQFFLGTPIMDVLDFLERLAPFSQPTLVLTDHRPNMKSRLRYVRR